MKWYYWVLIVLALGLIIYFATKKKKSVSNTNEIASNSTQTKVFNPYELNLIS